MDIASIFITVFAVMVECIIVIYYTNSTMNYRDSRAKSNLYIIAGFCIYAGICIYGNLILNIVCGMTVIFAALMLGFSDNIWNILLKTFLIMLFSMFGEWIAALFFKVELDIYFPENVSTLDDITYTLLSKLILFILIVLLKHISVKREKTYKLSYMLYFFVLPISTMFLLSCLGKISSEISGKHMLMLLLSATAVIIANYIVYIVYDKLIDTTEKINRLQEFNHKEELDYTAYEMMKEKYEDLRITIHNFEKYCQNIEGMLAAQQVTSTSLLNDLKKKNKEFLLVDFTNNTALNILLSQKMRICEKENIDFQIYAQDIDLSFIKEIDVVSIFSNLLDNAVESCRESESKKIYMSMKKFNSSVIVIGIDNSCDKEPIAAGGILKTQKENKEQHGWGMLSVKKSLKNYGGRIQWNYDQGQQIFSVTATLSIPSYFKNKTYSRLNDLQRNIFIILCSFHKMFIVYKIELDILTLLW